MIVGGVVSRTVITWYDLAVLPESVTVQVTVVTPIGNDPGASFVITAFGPAFVSVAVPRSTAVRSPVASTVREDGAEIRRGGVVSRTVTLCVAVAVLSAVSVAVQVTVVTPIGNDPGASFVIVGAESKMSVAVAVPRATVVNVPVASAVTSAGAVARGAPSPGRSATPGLWGQNEDNSRPTPLRYWYIGGRR